MAKMNYEHVYAAAGFSGERWDVNLGYNVSLNVVAGDAAWTAGNKRVTLTLGTIPTWMQQIGKVFTVDVGPNSGPFTVVNYDNATFKWVEVLETVVNDTPAGASTFDGSSDTKLQSLLLKNAAEPVEAALTEDAPLCLISSGALGANRTLNLAGMEVETLARGGQPLNGRFVYLSIQNTDVNNTLSGYRLRVKGSATVNGAAYVDINSPGDYWFVHDQNGAWRVNVLPTPGEALATLTRIPFTAAKWGQHPTNKNTIVCLQTGAPGAGQIGPHLLTIYSTYLIQVYNTDNATWTEQVDVEIKVDKLTGDITLQKAQKAIPFNGILVISGSLD